MDRRRPIHRHKREDGTYRLTAAADAGEWFSEASNSNNSTWADVKIRGNTVTVLRYGLSAQPV